MVGNGQERVVRGYLFDVLLPALQLGDENDFFSGWCRRIFHDYLCISRSRKCAGDDLDDQNPSRECVELVRVARFGTKSLWRHEHWCTRALGEATVGHARVGFQHLRHAEIGHFSLISSIDKNVVAGEVSVEDVVGVQVGEGQGDVERDAHLHVVGERGRRALQEAREALIHQLHEEDGSADRGCRDPAPPPGTARCRDALGPAGCGIPGRSERQSQRRRDRRI